MRNERALQAAFLLSGVAGLVYEVLWTRYLGLYVGHGAYAQVLVLSVYLGGMAVGSFAVAERAGGMARPLLWYARAELALACFGAAFHVSFTLAARLTYDYAFPALGSAALVGSARWAVAGLLILPQAIVLGATFPLMAAGLVRLHPDRPGRSVSRAYLLNTLGGAVGVLLAGFWMIGSLGFAGTGTAAAAMNLVAAALAWRAQVRSSTADPGGAAPADTAMGATHQDPVGRAARPREGSPRIELPPAAVGVLLAVCLGTAFASFTYEIGWIRMLSLVLGSATHAFELMLSAFILGLALGAMAIESRADRTGDPLRLLGWIQLLMGAAAAISIPVFYAVSFDVVARMVEALPSEPAGYTLFNLGRYGICLVVMLPATVLAGMTLPLITGTLLRQGRGERAIGAVYGVNTVGSVAGAALAGLIALPLLGLKGLILAGAALDIALGLWLLERAARWASGSLRSLAVAATLGIVALVGTQWGVRMSDLVLASGVFRSGRVPEPGDWQSLYHQDGRTATISAYIGTADGITVLATNGKPDASLEPLWRAERRDTLPERPLQVGHDFSTQVLSPVLALAYRPRARTAAIIGHGSGMSATSLLTSDDLERLVTIEIEPLTVEASATFLPANEAAFADPRATYVFDDAKSYFAYRQERFDIIFAEPSNPWVSGAAGLFTKEFYARLRTFLSDDGILAQWIQLYELDDDLFLSVVAALDSAFPSYRGYLVGDSDVAIVATPDTSLPRPDWSVLEAPRFLAMTAGVPRFRDIHMEPLLLFDETTLRPLLERGVAANSDYRPTLDLGAERARFERRSAVGIAGLGTSTVPLRATLAGLTIAPTPYRPVPTLGLTPALLTARGAWLRQAYEEGGGVAPEHFPAWQDELLHLRTFLRVTSGDAPMLSWSIWTAGFARAETALHFGTTGWAHEAFYSTVYAYLGRAAAPAAARAAVDLRHAVASLDWQRAASASDVLVDRATAGEAWLPPDNLLDLAVLANLRADRPAEARRAFDTLAPRTGRPATHLRNRLLEALVADAEAAARQPSR